MTGWPDWPVPDAALLASLPPGAVVRLRGWITRVQVEGSNEEITCQQGAGIQWAHGLTRPYQDEDLATVIRQIAVEWHRLVEEEDVEIEREIFMEEIFGTMASKVTPILERWKPA
jgi:hypothetical protein